jgi:hypothetical protein
VPVPIYTLVRFGMWTKCSPNPHRPKAFRSRRPCGISVAALRTHTKATSQKPTSS